MLLSFSVPSMLPMIRAGLRQHAGEDVGDARVKRQTIRKLGPRGEQLLAWDPLSHSIPYDLDIWWKSRTKERTCLGKVACRGVRLYRIDILHSMVEPPPRGPSYPVLRINGPRGWREGDSVLFWSPAHGGEQLVEEARRDGFDGAEEFRDFFVPRVGDRFDGVIFKW